MRRRCTASSFSTPTRAAAPSGLRLTRSSLPLWLYPRSPLFFPRPPPLHSLSHRAMTSNSSSQKSPGLDTDDSASSPPATSPLDSVPTSSPPLPTQSSPLSPTSTPPTTSSFLHTLGARLAGLRGPAASSALSPSSTPIPPTHSPLGFDSSKLLLPSLTPPRPPIVLLACGSYSPITSMHLLLFETARNHLQLTTSTFDVIGGIVSPVHDAYGKPSLVAAEHRVEMCRRATASSPWIATSAWETLQAGWTTTATTMTAYEKFVNAVYSPTSDSSELPPTRRVRLVLLCGADLLESFLVPGLWADEDVERILGHHGVAVIERVGLDLMKLIDGDERLRRHKEGIHIIPQRVVNNVSSTVVRTMVKEGLSIRYLVNDGVQQYIHQHQLYGHTREKEEKMVQHKAATPS